MTESKKLTKEEYVEQLKKCGLTNEEIEVSIKILYK